MQVAIFILGEARTEVHLQAGPQGSGSAKVDYLPIAMLTFVQVLAAALFMSRIRFGQYIA